MRNIYTEEHIEFLRDGYSKMGITDLTRVFNIKFRQKKTDSAIKSALKNHKITCGRTTGELKRGRFIFSPKQIDFIKKSYLSLNQKNLLKKFNDHFKTSFTSQQLKTFIANHNIISGRTGCFEKGHKPWNDGTKGQGLTGANICSFKKGNIPANIKPLGTERFTKDGYIEIKIAERNPYTGFPTRYRHKHVVIWERDHGPVPAGYAVSFIDGDKYNFDPGNLMLVSRAELLHLNRNHYRDLPAELKPGQLALTKLETKIFSLLNKGFSRGNCTQTSV